MRLTSWVLNAIVRVHIREKQRKITQTPRRRQAETRVLWPQAQKASSHQKRGEVRDAVFPRGSTALWDFRLEASRRLRE